MSDAMDSDGLVLDSIVVLGDIYAKKGQISKLIDEFELSRIAVKDVSKPHQKLAGTYYTPDDLSEYLVENTIDLCLTRKMNKKWGISVTNLEEWLENPTLEILSTLEQELVTLKILDFSAGSGVFLAAASNYLADLYKRIQQKKLDLGNGGSGYSMLEIRKHIITKMLYGIDIEQEAVKICKLRLLISLLSGFQPENYSSSVFSTPLPDLDFSVFCGNALIGFDGNFNQIGSKSPQDPLKMFSPSFDHFSRMVDEYKTLNRKTAIKSKRNILALVDKYSKDLNGHYKELLAKQNRKAPRNIEGYQPFHWILFFPELLDGGGFDVIIGNPPYNAYIAPDTLQLVNEIPSRGTLQSANLFIYKIFRLLKRKGCFGLVLPKSICHASNWTSTRKLLVPRIEKIIDAGKAFAGVLLEQILITGTREWSSNLQVSSSDFVTMMIGRAKTVKIPRQLMLEAEKIYLSLNQTEMDILAKVMSPRQFLGDLCNIQRGFPWQKIVSEKRGIPILEGKNINRNHIKKTFLSVPESIIKQEAADSSTFIKIKKMAEKKILLQNIVAHISKPIPFIELCAAIDENSYIDLDTVDNLFITEEPPEGVNYYSVTAFLNSSFTSWFAYRFIYAKAIRTMHFDNVQLKKLPFRYTSDVTVGEEMKQDIESIKRGRRNITAIIKKTAIIREKIAFLDDSRQIPPSLLLIAVLEEVLAELVEFRFQAWETILDYTAVILQIAQNLLFRKFKLQKSSKELFIRKLRTDRDLKPLYLKLEHSQKQALEKTLTAFFIELEEDRKVCLKLQQTIDDTIFDLFNLTEREIKEIKDNYVLRTNL